MERGRSWALEGHHVLEQDTQRGWAGLARAGRQQRALKGIVMPPQGATAS